MEWKRVTTEQIGLLAWTNQSIEQGVREIYYPEILKRKPQSLAPLCPGWRREQEEAADVGSSEPWSGSRADDINQQLARCVRATPLLIPRSWTHQIGTGTGNGWEKKSEIGPTMWTKPEGKQRCNLFYSHETDRFHVWKERTEKY
jgi:hypothetical protein